MLHGVALIDTNISLQDTPDQKTSICLEDTVVQTHLKKTEVRLSEMFKIHDYFFNHCHHNSCLPVFSLLLEDSVDVSGRSRWLWPEGIWEYTPRKCCCPRRHTASFLQHGAYGGLRGAAETITLLTGHKPGHATHPRQKYLSGTLKGHH